MQEAAPSEGDAFGQLLLQCWRDGGRTGVAHEIVERDDGFIGLSDAATYFAGPDEWQAPERAGLEHIVGRVLDVGCGAGRHAVTLAEAGHDVVGIDPSAGAIEIARERGVHAVQTTLSDLPAELGTFDTFVLFGANLALLGPAESCAETLTQLARAARPGARIVGSCLDPYATTSPDHLDYHDLNRERGRLPGHLRIRIRHRRLATPWFDYVFRSPDELIEAIADSPWHLLAIIPGGPAYVAVLELTP